MNERKAAVLVLVAIVTALSMLTGCVTPPGARPLMRSVWGGNVLKVEKHIDEGADVNARNRWLGTTVLHLAVRNGNLQIVTLLLEAGAATEVTDRSCQTPLMIAADSGDLEMVRLLIESGVNINTFNTCQAPDYSVPATALIAASRNLHSEVAQLLVKAGADVLHRDRNGETALDWTIRWLPAANPKRILETVVILVRAGEDGPRALELVRGAWWRGEMYLRDELTDMLYEAGATDPRRLATWGDYSEIAEYLKNWKRAEPVPAE